MVLIKSARRRPRRDSGGYWLTQIHRSLQQALILAVTLCIMISLTGCSMTPVFPMEDSGEAQFKGSVEGVRKFLLVPSRSTQIECRKSLRACDAFAESFRRSVYGNTGKQVVSEALTALNDAELTRVNAYAKEIGASHVIVWTVGIVDEMQAYSFSPHTFGVSLMTVRPVAASTATLYLVKPYSMLGLNNSPFVQLANTTGQRLGTYIAYSVR